MKKKLTWCVFIVSTCILTVYLYNLDPTTPIQAFFTACFISGALALIVPCIYQIKWRHDNGVDLFATLETDEEKLKEHMLFIMQYHGVEENLKELSDIFRNYPQWELQKWEVFRAWYKDQIDHMEKFPEIYNLTMKSDGSPYSKDKDPLYDPEAPDWALFDRVRNYEDEEDDDKEDNDDDFEDYGNTDKKIDVGSAIAFGIGLGAGLGIGGGDSSCDSGDGSGLT